MRKKLSLLSLLFGIMGSTNAQFYMGGNLSFTKYLGGSSLNSIGLGLTGEFSPDQDRSLTRVGLSYGIKKSYDEVFTATAIDQTTTTPTYIDVNGKSKLGFFNITFDYKRFFGDGDYEAGGFYGLLGVGLSFASISYSTESFDEAKYSLGFNIDEKDKFFQAVLRGGIGYDVELGFGNLYGELFLNIPANNVNGIAVSIQIPASVGLQAGIRIPLGG